MTGRPLNTVGDCCFCGIPVKPVEALYAEVGWSKRGPGAQGGTNALKHRIRLPQISHPLCAEREHLKRKGIASPEQQEAFNF